MANHRVGIVGTGPDPDEKVSGESFAMAYEHARAYETIANCEVVACADIVPQNARDFAGTFDLDPDHVYEDSHEMVARADIDVVSVCVPPPAHAEVVVGCAEEGIRAIHCEKPMASTWGACKRMVDTCENEGVQLTFNHQHRFGKPLQRTKDLIDAGRIGAVERIEYGWGDFYDNGTHAIDMTNYLNDDVPPTWVIGQVDYRDENVRYGVHTENQMLALWEYENGVYGMASTGAGAGLVDCHRVMGTEGTIEIGFGRSDGPDVRFKHDGSDGWEVIDCGGLFAPDLIENAIRDVVDAVDSDEESTLRARNALNTAAIVFSGYESARANERVELPLTIDDHPLESMLENGRIGPDRDG